MIKFNIFLEQHSELARIFRSLLIMKSLAKTYDIAQRLSDILPNIKLRSTSELLRNFRKPPDNFIILIGSLEFETLEDAVQYKLTNIRDGIIFAQLAKQGQPLPIHGQGNKMTTKLLERPGEDPAKLEVLITHQVMELMNEWADANIEHMNIIYVVIPGLNQASRPFKATIKFASTEDAANFARAWGAYVISPYVERTIPVPKLKKGGQ